MALVDLPVQIRQPGRTQDMGAMAPGLGGKLGYTVPREVRAENGHCIAWMRGGGEQALVPLIDRVSLSVSKGAAVRITSTGYN